MVADAGDARRDEVLPAAERASRASALPAPVGARREAELYLATARAHHERVRGRTKPETWAALAEAWAKVPDPVPGRQGALVADAGALPDRARRAPRRGAR